MAQELKDQKLQELMKNSEAIVALEREMWAGFKPRIIVDINGENYNIISELETLKTFIALEADPVRRSALVELAMEKKGIDVSKLPKTPPQPPQPQAAPQVAPQGQPMGRGPLDMAMQATSQ
jgi:hypothetical protein